MSFINQWIHYKKGHSVIQTLKDVAKTPQISLTNPSLKTNLLHGQMILNRSIPFRIIFVPFVKRSYLDENDLVIGVEYASMPPTRCQANSMPSQLDARPTRSENI